MTSKELPDDILSKFLEETKEAEQKKKKPEKVKLPKNFVVYDPKAAAKKRRDEALAELHKLTHRPGQKRTTIGSVMSTKMKNPSPSLSFGVESKNQKENDAEKKSDENEEEEEESI